MSQSEADDTKGTMQRFRDFAASCWMHCQKWMDKGESRYLTGLRFLFLTFASLLLIGFAVMLLLGVGRQIGTGAVEPEVVSVSGTDLIVPAETGTPAAEPKNAPTNRPRWERDLSREFRNQYWALFNGDLKPHYRTTDTAPTREQLFARLFPDSILDKIQSYDPGTFVAPEAPDGATPAERALLAALSAAVRNDQTVRELRAYKAARRERVCRNVNLTRTRFVDGWDSYSTACPYWWESPMGCPVRRRVTEPYSEQRCEMQFPAELDDPAEVMSDMQDRFLVTLDQRLASARFDAEEATTRRLQRKADGRENIKLSLQLLAGFAAAMFLYLFVAIERSQRLIAAQGIQSIPKEDP